MVNRWEGTQEFMLVTQLGSFTAAAAALEVSTAHISRQVQRLEERLGVKLIHRTTRKITLTDVGQTYSQQLKSVYELLDEANSQAGSMQTAISGKLRMTAPVTFGEEQVVPLLNEFMLRYPDIRISCHFSNSNEDLVEEGIDLAVRIGSLKDSSMKASRLTERQRITCAAPSYLKDYGCPFTLSELERHQCLCNQNDHWRFRENGRARSVRVHGRVHYNSGHALVDAAVRGLGLIQLPDHYVLKQIRDGQLVPVLEAFQEDHEVVWAVYPFTRHMPVKVRILIDWLRSGLSPDQPVT